MKKSLLLVVLVFLLSHFYVGAQMIDWCNLEDPGSVSIYNNDTLFILGAIHVAGVTGELEEESPDINAWVGISSENTDPSTWALWTPAYFQYSEGDYDFYRGHFPELSAGTYYVATRFTYLGGDNVYGGYNEEGGGFWDGTENVSGIVTVTDVPGSNCNSPIIVELPIQSPAIFEDQTSCGMVNAYNQTCLGNYDSGQDVIYKLEITEPGILDVEFDPSGTLRTGIALFDDCPNVGECLVYYYDNTANIRYLNAALLPGVYYLMLDQYPIVLNCIESYNLNISFDADICLEPTDLAVFNVLQEEATLSWNPGLGETEWHIIYGESGFDVDSEGILLDTDIISPFTITNMEMNTAYDAYVRAKCNEGLFSEWTGPVSFTTLELCPSPTDVNVDNITQNSATIYWTPEINTDKWNLKLGEPGFDPNQSEEIILVPEITVTHHEFTELTSNTQYEIYIQTVCELELGNWMGPVDFYTECDIITEFPWIETFEDNSEHRNCWTQEFVVGQLAWEFQSGATAGQINNAFYGELNASFFQYSAQLMITKLVSPILDITQIDTPILTFWYAQEEYSWGGETDQNELKVYYRTAPENNWILLEHFDQNITEWTKVGIELPEQSETFQFAFEGIHNYGRDNVVDYVKVKSVNDLPKINEIDIYEEVQDISVGLGTPEHEAIAELVSQITITDTYETEHTVQLDWIIENYNGNALGDYLATGHFNLPGGVYQTDPETELTVHAMVTVWDNPVIQVIDVYNEVNDIEVGYGTTESQAISQLQDQITIQDSHDNEYIVNLVWTIEEYNGQIPGNYNASGAFGLPEGVYQTDPETQLKVFAVITVLEPPVIEVIDVHEEVSDIQVDYGTSEVQAINQLQNHITISDSYSNEHIVNLTWTIEDYNGEIPDDYHATGTFLLPEGVNQTDPETDLVVNAVVTVLEPNFVDGFNRENLKIFPNPNNGNFIISFENGLENMSYEIIDTKGRTIFSELYPDNTGMIEVNLDISPGFYFLKIRHSEYVIIERLVIN